MSNVIPIFTSDASLGKSILSADDPEKVDKETGKKIFKPLNTSESISIWTIANENKLDPVYIVENSMVSFINHYKYSQKLNKQLIFGVKFIITADPSNKDDKSKLSDSNVIIWIKNSEGYKDLIKLFTAIHGNPDNYFWSKFDFKAFYRGTWKILQEYVTDNLVLTIPFYDSFLHKNLLTYGAIAIPEFGKLKPTFLLENHELPFDKLLRENVIHYCEEHKYEIVENHSIYYYLNSDAKSFQVFKCITNRSKYDMPDLEYFGSDKFSFESYKERLDEKE